ncbi:MAG: hypothetical protein HQK53_17340 [Oligoflexia bacterium]|nr:hypothetical protein [Oligoflexia bacterium]
MSSKARIIKSRNLWKQKAKNNADRNRYLERENKRLRGRGNEYKEKAYKVELKLKIYQQQNLNLTIKNKTDLVYLALQLFITARIGFRAVSRVLEVLQKYLGLERIPCPQTIINWITRLSIVKMERPFQIIGNRPCGDIFSNGFYWMIDVSIGLGVGKILSVLALNIHYHQFNSGAPSLKNVHCIGVSVAASWNGETIADFLKKIIEIRGRPSAFIKDGGTDLAKAVRILNEQGFHSLAIDDISHVVANFFKHVYGEHPMFETFLSTCGEISKKLKQTILACLAPPKVSIKARFMNLHRLVNWANNLLKHSPVGRVVNDSLVAKLRKNLGQLPACKEFINLFLRDAIPLLECQKLLKTQGLSKVTWDQCNKLIAIIPERSLVRIGFIKWGEKHLKLAESLALDKLTITSDGIESLYGVGKQHGTGEVKDANRIAIRLPAMCGELTKEDAHAVLDVSVKKQEEIIGDLLSITKQRRDILPNPGNIEKKLLNKNKTDLELLPVAKNRSKNSKLLDLDAFSTKADCSPITTLNSSLSDCLESLPLTG